MPDDFFVKTTLDKSIFLVEDDISLQKALKRTLARAGYKVFVFSTGTDFIEYLDANDIGKMSCIILDYDLPDINGIEIQSSLKQIIDLPIIFISGAATSATIIQAWRLGAYDFLLKPFQPEELLNVLTATFAKRENLNNKTIDYQDLNLEKKSLLTPREKEVLKLVAEGNTNPQIAEALGLTVRTIKMHRSNLMIKLELKSIADIVRFYDYCQGLSDEN